jgi:hypothetical protein
MNPNLSMAMVQARQQDLLRAGTGYHGGGRIRTRRFRHKLSLSLGLRRSPATGVTGAQATPAA